MVSKDNIPKLTHIQSKVMEQYQYKGLAAGYRYQKQEVFVEEHPVITGARRGDLIRVMRYVEGGHRIYVWDFQMSVFHKNPL